MKLKLTILFIAVLTLSMKVTQAQKKWQDVTSIEDVCNTFPGEINKIFTNFNLDYPGLEKVKKEYGNGNINAACHYLLAYYKKGNSASNLRIKQPRASDARVALGDTILKDVFVIQTVKGQVPYGKDGHRDWNYRGPNNDIEWSWLSNRHPQIDSLFQIYKRTGNKEYAAYIDLFLRDFIIKSIPYPAKPAATDIWRGLEVSFRAKVWPKIFYGLLNSEHLSPATQLLMLSSMPDHAHYNRHFHKKKGNWLTMEISGLATIVTTFPEIKNSDEWLDYAIHEMGKSMKEQVYPDGVQTELTSHYHAVALESFVELKELSENVGKEIPESYNNTLEKMYAYLAHMLRPDGTGPLNNDSDRNDYRELILKGAKTFHREDWKYIATNGMSGKKPSNGPSFFYPWSGHLTFRSSYDKNAHWSFFDMGPWGTGHEHSDKLHISVAAYGRDLLVDAGRFSYSGKLYEKYRAYGIGSEGHNLLLIDNMGQNPGPPSVTSPVSDKHFRTEDSFDYASDSFRDYKVDGQVNHIRSIFYVRGEFWVIVDRVLTEQPREIKTLWHWHPSCKVVKDGDITKSDNPFGNLAVIPVSNQSFNLAMVKGQDNPVQGWYSVEYNKVEENTTSIYTNSINEDATMVWLLVPAENAIPNVTARVTSSKTDKVEVEVKLSNKTWQIDIPFLDGSKAKLIEH
ncbi:heparinase [Fulvivirga sp. M361]|nr:heparinase [Fulvivirga sp. M361]